MKLAGLNLGEVKGDFNLFGGVDLLQKNRPERRTSWKGAQKFS